MPGEMTEALKAGTEAMGKIKGMLDEITSLTVEITGIINEGRRKLAVYDCLETFRVTRGGS